MFISFKPVNEIIGYDESFKSLINSSAYYAHRHVGIEPELLEKHVNLVNRYLCLLVDINELDTVIDRLIVNFIKENNVKENSITSLGNLMKLVFVRTIIFHDFGKVNPNFQGEKEKMDNPFFVTKMLTNYVLKSHHSKLGAYLYLVKHYKDILESGIKGFEQHLCLTFVFFLCYPIIRHHASGLDKIDKSNINFNNKELEAMKSYLPNYQMELPQNLSLLATDIFSEKIVDKNFFSPFDKETIKGGFPLYALTRLNFSLLTASDYLATSEYMNQKPVTDFGLIDDCLRTKILTAARTSHDYNVKAYEIANSKDIIENPIVRSANNLNVLRQNMAVEVIRTIRKNKHERLFYLEAPTGGGKTNISMLAVAELLEANKELNKVFYVFPFTTLITQTHTAIKNTLGLDENEISVLHAKAGFQTKAEDDNYGDKKIDYLNNLFVHYPVCLLTHIRFFDILKTNEKETNYLLHRIANSIVIIDELQSYTPVHWDKMLYFIQHYAAAFNIRFILMSATLPRIDKLNLPLTNRPAFIDLLPDAKEYFTNKNFADRVKFRFNYYDQKLEMAELAEIVLAKSAEYAAKSKDGGVFTIVEFIFKKSTTEFDQAIGERFFDSVFVLSGTILESRRREIINFLKNKATRNYKVLLITTQVVEAGVDIDMDLGFKNVSLIDSDEQLAGRVNRNVLKELCEVYLFKINEPSLLYKKDMRFAVTKNQLTKEEHEEILKDKDFEKLYNLVLQRIDKTNTIEEIQNFNSDYLPEINMLNYYQIHQKFKLIEENNISVFVPLNLSKQVNSAEGKPESVFSKNELNFLEKFGIDISGSTISGEEVWKVYKLILLNKAKDFINQKIEKKTISGILSKFTFSVFANRSTRLNLESFSSSSTDEDNELRGFDNYIYLAHHSQCYDYKKGLIESKFEDSESFIL